MTNSNETKESPAQPVIRNVAHNALDPFMNTTCPTWCEEAQRHPFRYHPEDRNHFGEYRHVLLQLVNAGAVGDGSHELATAAVYLRQHYRDAEPTVWVGELDSLGLTLTLDEARALASALLATIEEAGR
ncbi:hypothetical protein BH10ACT8_BH10ACT8_11160 [soil metagenome]